MSNTTVFIGGLNPRVRKNDVDRFFKGYGRLREISLKSGYGFVEFYDARLVFLILVYFGQSLCTF